MSEPPTKASQPGAVEWIAAARAALERGRPAQALKALDRAAPEGAARDRVDFLRARAHFALGDRNRARDLLEAVAQRGDAGSAALAAKALVDQGELGIAVPIAERVLARDPAQAQALEVMIAAARMGWFHEAIAAAESSVRASGRGDARMIAAHLYESLREDEAAAEHARAALAREPERIDAWLLLARTNARAGRWAPAVRAASSASALVREPGARLYDVIEARLLAGDVAGAEADLLRLLEREDTRTDAGAWLAELALWRVDLDLAERRAHEVLGRDPRNARAAMVLGGAAMLRGDLAGAEGQLDRALELDPDHVTARHFRGEVRRKRGRQIDARLDLDLSIARSPRFTPSAYANRLLSTGADHAGNPVPYSGENLEDLILPLEVLAGPPDASVRAGLRPACEAFLERALAGLGGNRTATPTRVIDGRIEPVFLPHSARVDARYHQEYVRSRPVDDVLAGFARVIEIHGEQPTIDCHHGETLLWVGRYEEALRAFERALVLDRETRWAWIGLAASRLFLGDLAGSERTIAEGIATVTPGRTLYTYRGELNLALGRLDDAQADLARARQMNPERLALDLLDARVALARGQREVATRALDHAALAAPAFFADVVRAGADPSDPDASSRTALSMMRGNRSSSFVTYFTADGRMRFVPPPRIEAVRLD